MINPKKLDIEFKPSEEIKTEFDSTRCERINPEIYNAYQKAKTVKDDMPLKSEYLTKSFKVNRFEKYSLMLKHKETIIDILYEVDDKIRVRFNHLNK